MFWAKQNKVEKVQLVGGLYTNILITEKQFFIKVIFRSVDKRVNQNFKYKAQQHNN